MNPNNNIYHQRTYNLYVGGNNYPINIESENNIEDSDLGQSQNDEKMFNIINESEKTMKEFSETIKGANERLKMYALKNMENAKRMRQNYMNHFRTSEEFYHGNKNFSPNMNRFNYNDPPRIYKPNFEIPNKLPNNYITDNKFMNINNINKLDNGNHFRNKTFDKINNKHKIEENKKEEENLNFQNENKHIIKKGFIKRAKSAANTNHNKLINNTDELSISSDTFFENQKKFNYSNKSREKMAKCINAIILKNEELIKENDDCKKEIREKDLKIEALEEKLKNLENQRKSSDKKNKDADDNKQKDNNVDEKEQQKSSNTENNNNSNSSEESESDDDNNNDSNNNDPRKRRSKINIDLGNDISIYKKTLADFEDMYDKVYHDNVKLKARKKKYKNDVKKLKKEKKLNSQYLEDAKKATEENYALKGKILSLTKDNEILFNKVKKLEEENEMIQKENKELKIKSEEITIENFKMEEKTKELTDKYKTKKIEKEKLNKNLENAEKTIDNMKKEIEALKQKCIKCQILENQNEKLVLAKKQKEVEIKELNKIIKKLEEKQYDDEEEHQPEEQENINNSKIIEELKEKDGLIQNLKDGKENLEYQLNQTRAKLTEMEAKVETQKALVKKFHENLKEIKNLKEENKKLIEDNKQKKQKNNELENRIKELENIKFKKNKPKNE